MHHLMKWCHLKHHLLDLDNHFDLKNYSLSAAEAARKKTVTKGIIFCLPSVTTSAVGKEVKCALYLTLLINVLLSVDLMSFVHKNLQSGKPSTNFCQSSLLIEWTLLSTALGYKKT